MDVYANARWDGGNATLTAASALPCLPAIRESSTLTPKIHGQQILRPVRKSKRKTRALFYQNSVRRRHVRLVAACATSSGTSAAGNTEILQKRGPRPLTLRARPDPTYYSGLRGESSRPVPLPPPPNFSKPYREPRNLRKFLGFY